MMLYLDALFSIRMARFAAFDNFLPPTATKNVAAAVKILIALRFINGCKALKVFFPFLFFGNAELNFRFYARVSK